MAMRKSLCAGFSFGLSTCAATWPGASLERSIASHVDDRGC
jgi:hypothetical protein